MRARRAWTAAAVAAAVGLPATGAGAARAVTTPQVRVANAIVLGSPGGAVTAIIPITLYAPAKTAVTVHYLTHTVAGETNAAQPGVDYTAVSGSVTFAPGEVEQDVKVTIRRRPVTLPYKVFHLALDSVTGATALRTTGLVRVDYPQTSVVLSGSKPLFDPEAPGGGKTYVATVTFALSAKLDHAVTGSYSEVPQSAADATYYVPKTGTLTIPAGKLAASVRIKLLRPTPDTAIHHIEVRLEPLSGVPDQGIASGFIQVG